MYVDDSGSDKSSHVYVLAGVSLPSDWWQKVSSAWSAVLVQEPPVEYYKAQAVWDSKKGPFKALDSAQRIAKVHALANVLCTYNPMCHSCHLERRVFEKFKRE